MTEYTCAVNIMNDYRYGTLYIGVTNNLQRRVLEHKRKTNRGFTQQYGLTRLCITKRVRISPLRFIAKKFSKMAPRLEDTAHRKNESYLERSLARHRARLSRPRCPPSICHPVPFCVAKRGNVNGTPRG